tara:strand:+ start:110 stop:1624 length:1515 start_codon:yes stop_codon:yes gene_type:complete
MSILSRFNEGSQKAFDDYVNTYLGPKGVAFTSPNKTAYDIAVNRAAAKVPSQTLEGTFPGIVGQALGTFSDLAMPSLALGASPFYDMYQASDRARAQYGQPDVRSVVDDAEIPMGPSLPEYARAVADENILSSAIGRAGGAGQNLADRFGRISEGINNLFFTPAGAAEVTPNALIDADLEGIGKDADYIGYTDQEKADIAAGKKTPQLGELIDFGLGNIGKVDQSLLDDAFEQQLALATRTGTSGGLRGILENLDPKDAASFITGLLTGGASTALSGVASFADRLGIRRGMSEPRGAVGTGGYGVSRQGNTLTNKTRANRADFSDFYQNFRGGAQQQMGRRVDDVISRVGSGRRTRSDAKNFVDRYGSEEQKENFAAAQARNSTIAQERANRDAARGGGGSSGGGGGKIVCTMMNESYGFGSFRNKIWLKHSKGLAPEYQKGYHRIFLPLVKIAKKNKIVKKILEHIAVHRTIDIRQEARGKMHLLGRVYRKILEPICYWAGKK